MILGQISWADCLSFLLFLAPQLLLHVSLEDLLRCAFKAIPFLVFVMPFQLINERYFTSPAGQSPFVRQSTLFQDLVIRCVRYAFSEIPASIGKVFFSKPVALPFFTFRKLRHGFLRTPIHWEEIDQPGLRGIYMVTDPSQDPDIAVYYCHGGGFSMGSSFFYIEFLLAWVSLLLESGHTNPALFALEYTLVPEAVYPKQLEEVQAGYNFIRSKIDSPERIVVGGDSAGATLMMSLLLAQTRNKEKSSRSAAPGMAVLISPWITILSSLNKNTSSDYLDADSLRLYGEQYLGKRAGHSDSVASPGSNNDLGWWERAAPVHGWYLTYGAEEVFAPDARRLTRVLRQSGAQVDVYEEDSWIHAWPVVKLFLSNTQEERQKGLRNIVRAIEARMPPVSRSISAGKDSR